MRHTLSLAAICGMLAVAGTTSAQDVQEAFNLSNLTVQGTARSMGFGNALGSIGGDFSSVSVNPAGLGVYRTSEFSFTPSLRMNGTSSDYLGKTTLDNNVRFGVNSFAMVFTDAPKGKRYERRRWKAVSFAFGMNRVADFNRNYTYRGVNNTSSATQAFEADANQYYNDPTSEVPLSVPGYVGYQAYLVDPYTNPTDPTGKYYISVVPFSGGINQEKTVKERGRVTEYTFSLGGNYEEKLMLGATLGIPTFKYILNSTFSESLASNFSGSNPSVFNSYSYSQNLKLTGTGVNLKLGGIYKVNDKVRLGAAFHTPTAYYISDQYNPAIVSNIGGTVTSLNTSNLLAGNSFNYTFVSAWRGLLSASYVMKGIGFITADYEYAGYGSMGYIYPVDNGSGNNYAAQEAAMNAEIKDTYKSTSNFRLGVEGLLSKYMMARVGFGYYGNPYRNAGLNGQRMDFSVGTGFRGQHFFTDIAFVHSMYKSQNVPYTVDYNYVFSGSPAQIPMATTNYAMNNIALTVGVKF